MMRDGVSNLDKIETLSSGLSRFLVAIRLDELPAPVRARAEVAVLDTLACIAAGADAAEPRIVGASLASMLGAGLSDDGSGAHAIGVDGRCAVGRAAAINGTAAFALNLGDTSLRTLCHCGPVVVPAALAVAEGAGADGASLLEAVVAGYEAMERVGRALGGTELGLVRRGFHPTGVAGVFGAAAATARLRGLDAGRLAGAFGIAGSLMTGVRQAAHTDGDTSMIWAHAGFAAGLGVLAVDLAARGMEGPLDVFEGREGILRSYGAEEGDPTALVANLGTDWMLPAVAVKLHACSHTLATAVDAAVAIRARLPLPDSLERIEDIEVRLDEFQRFVSAGREAGPASFVDAQSSVGFVVAQALRFGHVMPAQFAPSELASPAARALAERVRIVPGAFPQGSWPAAVRVSLRDGHVDEEALLEPQGGERLPVGLGRIAEKLALVAPWLSPAAVAALRVETERLATASSVDGLQAVFN
jgi:2-methylcitrate dehydratase PrpD